jgi:type I restriction enzyme S subunit
LPSNEEQIAIVNFLDAKTAKIDTAIAQKERLIELLRERRQIIIQTAVTKGLDPTVKFKDSGVECLGGIPIHWNRVAIKRVVNQQPNAMVDGPFGSSVNVSELVITQIFKKEDKASSL